jgi:hypothetical protein
LIVSIAHGSLNNWGQYAFKYMQDSPKDFELQQICLLAGVSGSLLITGLIILATIKTKGG